MALACVDASLELLGCLLAEDLQHAWPVLLVVGVQVTAVEHLIATLAVAADAPPPPTLRCGCVSKPSPYVRGGGSRDGSSHDNGGDGCGDVAHWRVALHRCSAARARAECSASTRLTMSWYAPDQLLSMRPLPQP